MFSHNLIENSSNQVNMNDWDSHIVRAFVKFLYCGEIDIVESCIPQTSLKNYKSNKNNYKLTTIPESKVANAIISTLYRNNNDESSPETVFGLEVDENKSS